MIYRWCKLHLWVIAPKSAPIIAMSNSLLHSRSRRRFPNIPFRICLSAPALAYLPLPNRGDSIGSRRSVDANHVTRLRCPSIRAMARFRMQDHGYYKMSTVTIVSMLLMSARPRYPHPGTNIGIERRDIRMTMTWRGRMVKSIRSIDRNQVVLHLELS